jgi:hypothetical protein
LLSAQAHRSSSGCTQRKVLYPRRHEAYRSNTGRSAKIRLRTQGTTVETRGIVGPHHTHKGRKALSRLKITDPAPNPTLGTKATRTHLSLISPELADELDFALLAYLSGRAESEMAETFVRQLAEQYPRGTARTTPQNLTGRSRREPRIAHPSRGIDRTAHPGPRNALPSPSGPGPGRHAPNILPFSPATA